MIFRQKRFRIRATTALTLENTAVNIHTTIFNILKLYVYFVPHNVFLRCVRLSDSINGLVFIMETKCVLCERGLEFLCLNYKF